MPTRSVRVEITYLRACRRSTIYRRVSSLARSVVPRKEIHFQMRNLCWPGTYLECLLQTLKMSALHASTLYNSLSLLENWKRHGQHDSKNKYLERVVLKISSFRTAAFTERPAPPVTQHSQMVPDPVSHTRFIPVPNVDDEGNVGHGNDGSEKQSLGASGDIGQTGLESIVNKSDITALQFDQATFTIQRVCDNGLTQPLQGFQRFHCLQELNGFQGIGDYKMIVVVTKDKASASVVAN